MMKLGLKCRFVVVVVVVVVADDEEYKEIADGNGDVAGVMANGDGKDDKSKNEKRRVIIPSTMTSSM